MRRLLALVAVLAMTACGGPAPKLSFGGKAVPVNVAFGKPAADDPRAPTTEYVLAPVLGGVGVVPVAPPRAKTRVLETFPEPEPAVGACGPADARIPPVEEATRSLSEAGPPAGQYPYRIAGTVDNLAIDGGFTRTVSAAADELDGSRRFTVSTDVMGVKQTWTYSTRPSAQGRVPGYVGLLGVEAAGRGIDGRPSFHSAKALTLLPLDATDAASVQDAASDPTTGSTMTVTGTVLGKGKVWACGANIDAWQVKLSQRVVTPLQRIDAEITYWIATQYGGLVVQESVQWSGTAGLQPVQGQYLATISKVPGT